MIFHDGFYHIEVIIIIMEERIIKEERAGTLILIVLRWSIKISLSSPIV